MKNELITVNPQLKIKGFDSDNLRIVAPTREDLQVRRRISRLLTTPFYNQLSETNKTLVSKILAGYNNIVEEKPVEDSQYILAGHELVEFDNLHDRKAFRYLVYRYKYNLYPKLKIVEDYPPCVQIEIASICNFRCVFCYQADKTFSNKNSGYMGFMEFDLFKKVIDELAGKVESITLASRGEPTLHKELEKMLRHMEGKFLAVKINTNASLLNDRLIHVILSSDVQTMAFSIDAADRELYETLRVNGKFEKTLKNVKRFYEIKEKEYPNSRMTTRISGVKVNMMQDINEMEDRWAQYADIVAFTNYTPWQTSYANPKNTIRLPCTELWRRLFVWWDGTVNPCDYDYKSTLSTWHASDSTIGEIWNSEHYEMMRDKHLNEQRNEYEPCVRCISV